MFDLHEPTISRTRRILGYILVLLPSFGVLGSGIMKFFPGGEIHLLLEQLNFAEYTVIIGLAEIAIVMLYAFPRTFNIGFFLFCSYIGAIFVAELILGQVPLPALAIGVMVYVGTYLLRPSLFGGAAGAG